LAACVPCVLHAVQTGMLTQGGQGGRLAPLPSGFPIPFLHTFH
jgi:hypothetical protein